MSAIIETTPGLQVLFKEPIKEKGVYRWSLCIVTTASIDKPLQVRVPLGHFMACVYDSGWLGIRRHVFDTPPISILPDDEGIEYWDHFAGKTARVDPGTVLQVSNPERIWPRLLIKVQ